MKEYTDKGNNVHTIKQSIMTDKEREDAENKIVEELYKIFTQK